VAVIALGAAAHRPLARVPENTLKYGVGLMLTSFGTFWSVEGIGIVRGGGESLHWPGGTVAILGLLAAWLLLSRGLVRALPRLRAGRASAPQVPEEASP